MIDIEIDVFDYVSRKLAEEKPNVSFESVFVPELSKFPHATLMEMDNITDNRRGTQRTAEEYAIVTYEAQVYALDKFDCREIMGIIDDAMLDLGFSRMSMQFVPNLQDARIFRIVTRYQAEADKEKVIYRRR